MFEAVPSTLKFKRNWCVHRTDGGKAKVPHAIGGYKLAWSIPANWITFIDAEKAFLEGLNLPDGHKRKFDGLGYFISREKDATLDVYAVDLDHCRNSEMGEIDEWAQKLLKELNSYSEVSPSGTGVHVFVKGMLPEGAKNTNDLNKDKNRIEVFTNKHHITITGIYI
jgi:putative DNA primase/helicase